MPASGDWIGPAWLPPRYGDLTEAQLRDATTAQRIASRHPDGVRIVALMVGSVINYYEFVGHHPCDGRLLCKAFNNGSSFHYEGPKNQERRVKGWRSKGNPVWLAGPRNQEREVRELHPSGEIQLFEGERHKERIVLSTWPDGQTQHYRGAQGAEHLVKIEWPDGTSLLVVGPKNCERKLREIEPDGAYRDYCGPKGKEVVSRSVSPGGTETSFRLTGPGKLQSAVDRITRPGGSYVDFGGEAGKEYKIASLLLGPPRKLAIYSGKKRGHERLVQVGYLRDDVAVDPDWSPACDDFYKAEVYQGPKGLERLCKTEHVPVRGYLQEETHTMEYVGPKGQERLKHVTWCDRKDYYRTNADGCSYRYATWWLCGTMDEFDRWGSKISSYPCPSQPGKAPSASGAEAGETSTLLQKKRKKAPRRAPAADPEALRRAAVRKRWRSAAWRAVRLARADAEATRANEEARDQHRTVREQCDATKAARAERPYTAPGPSHREGAATWVAGDAPDARDEAKRAAEKDASRAAAAEAKAARAALLKRGNEGYLEQMRLLRVAEAIGGSK